MTVQLHVFCDYDAKYSSVAQFAWSDKNFDPDNCLITAKYVGKEGCPLIDATVIKDYYAYGDYFCILLGLFLIFAGAKFLLYVMTIGAFWASWAGSFFLLLNFEIISDPRIPDDDILNDPEKRDLPPDWTWVFVAIGACLALAVVATYMFHRVFKKSLTWCLGGVFGIFLVRALIPAIGFEHNPCQYVFMMMGAIAGGYIGKQLDRVLKTFCTAMWGSVLLVEAVVELLPGHEDHNHKVLGAGSELHEHGHSREEVWIIIG